MKWIGRSLALICAADIALVAMQFARNARWARYQRWCNRPLTYQDCLDFMIELHSNDLLAPIAEEN
jgi:hypothetical protein